MSLVEKQNVQTEPVVFRKSPVYGKKLIVRVALLGILTLLMVMIPPFKLWWAVHQGRHILWSTRLYIALGLTEFIFPILFVFIAFGAFKSFRQRNRWIEVTSSTIAEKEVDGFQVNLMWGEIDKLQDSTNGAWIVLVGNGKRIRISRDYEGYDRLIRRIYDEKEKQNRSQNESVKSYPMNPEAKQTAWLGLVVSGVFIMFWIAVSVHEVIENGYKAYIIGYVVFAVGSGGLFAYCFRLLRSTESRIRISDDGVSKVEPDGSLVSIRWNQISGLIQKPIMQQLAVFDQSGNKRILVDYQFSGFDHIKERLFKEYGNHVSPFSLPSTIGRLPVLPNIPITIISWIFIGLFGWGLFNDPHRQTGVWIGMIVLCIVFFYLYLHGDSKKVKAVTLQTESLILHRIFGKISLKWNEVLGIRIESSGKEQMRLYSVVIETRNMETYELFSLMPEQIEVFIRIKKILKENKTT